MSDNNRNLFDRLVFLKKALNEKKCDDKFLKSLEKELEKVKYQIGANLTKKVDNLKALYKEFE